MIEIRPDIHDRFVAAFARATARLDAADRASAADTRYDSGKNAWSSGIAGSDEARRQRRYANVERAARARAIKAAKNARGGSSDEGR